MDFADRVASECEQVYKSLPSSGKAIEGEWEVVAGIVIQKGDRLECIALATGSKCLGGSNLSSLGDVVNDCHAEILVRRVSTLLFTCFLCFF